MTMQLARFTVAYWCVLLAALLPYVCATLAKSGGFGKPRAQGGFEGAGDVAAGEVAQDANPRIRDVLDAREGGVTGARVGDHVFVFGIELLEDGPQLDLDL